MKKGVKKKLIIILIIFIILSSIFIFTNAYKLFISYFDMGEEISDDYGSVILVLGGGLRKGLKLGFSTSERVLLAMALYRTKKQKIIVSDGSLYKGSKAIKILNDFMIKGGVNEEDIIIEGKSQTTYENFIYTHKIIQELSGKEVIICTSPYHQRRAKMIIEDLYYFYEFKIAKMEKSEVYQVGSVKKRLRNMGLILREIGAIIKYKIFFKGDRKKNNVKKSRY